MWMSFVYYLSKVIALSFSWIYFRFWRYGKEHVPKSGPVLLVSNHASHLDPMLVGIACPRRVRFMARASLARVPLLAGWMRAVGVILLDRKSGLKESMAKGIEVLDESGVLCLFAEGTRSRNGGVREFQRGSLLLLKKSGATVVPVGVRGSFSAFPRGKRLPRPRRCTVHFGAPISAQEVLADGGLAELRRRVAELAASPLDDEASVSSS